MPIVLLYSVFGRNKIADNKIDATSHLRSVFHFATNKGMGARDSQYCVMEISSYHCVLRDASGNRPPMDIFHGHIVTNRDHQVYLFSLWVCRGVKTNKIPADRTLLCIYPWFHIRHIYRRDNHCTVVHGNSNGRTEDLKKTSNHNHKY